MKSKNDISDNFAQNIDCGYKLKPPRRDSSNEYPQSMFWIKNEKNWYTPETSFFTIELPRGKTDNVVSEQV